MPALGPNGNGRPAPASANGARVTPTSPALQKLEGDALKLIQTLKGLHEAGEQQSLRAIAELTGLSKDEVNRYLNPNVNEVYNLERLVHVRNRNRPLYNHLIVSGPPTQDTTGHWAGIVANTSKFPLFRAVALRYGWDVRFIGDRGLIVDVEYRGIEEMAVDRMGKVFASQEPILYLD